MDIRIRYTADVINIKVWKKMVDDFKENEWIKELTYGKK